MYFHENTDTFLLVHISIIMALEKATYPPLWQYRDSHIVKCVMVELLYTEGIQLTVAQLIPVVDVLISPRSKCNIYGATTYITRDSIITSLVLVHANYLLRN